MENKNANYPCINCVYFNECGDNTRTEKCEGRKENNQKRKVKVHVEEHLCRCIEVEIPDNVFDIDAMDFAERKVKEMVDNEEIVLTADDYNGVRLYCVEDEDGKATDWHE